MYLQLKTYIEDKYSIISSIEEIKQNNYSLNIPLYVRNGIVIEEKYILSECIDNWEASRLRLVDCIQVLTDMIK